ncbi:heavy metal-associated isoprenylated plant protein 7-like [Salvia divinorum]|uniref:Heavy metal-associated isoprenylated plant protein 7-like n=1 Tax=Salvia divinorum TaxID=28513 RepID=A0ABD1HY59_SALDI
MGEEKKEDVSAEKKKEEVKEEKTEEEEEEVKEIVLKVDMHCEACARKVARALKGFQGVEEVRADCKASKVVVKVKGKGADPIKVCQRIEKKSGRKVKIISPLPNKEEEDDNKLQENKDPQPIQANKQQPPPVITVVLKVRMHCEACAQGLQKRIGKVHGVESVTTDIANDRVIVKGVLDPEKLVNDVYKRTGKHASIVKDEEKKEEEKEEKQDDKKEAEENKEDEDDKKTEIKKMEHWPSNYYHLEHAYAPQFFSDENPNACIVM